jgi:DNA polymerase-3 subunit gamma/tau
MSYLVLARKYRPMFFADVMGQEHVTVTLQNAIEKNRVANAYLFSGPRGVGKTTVARLLAKALNCENGPTVTPCNECSPCIEINESRSLDVFEIDGASNRGIDEVRNLREGLRYSASPGKYRIYIIDEVHMLTNEAFNALLKTLEEPPSKVLFIFATTEAHKVPATILSRCQRFDFKRLSNRLIVEQLEHLCEKEDLRVDEEAFRLIAAKADGGMRDALSLLDQIIAFAGKDINADDVIQLLGMIGQDLYFEASDLIREGDVGGAVQLANNIFVQGYDFNEFLIGLTEHLRNFLIALTTGSGKELDVSEVYERRYLAECSQFSVEDLLRYIKIASDAENLIRRSSNARMHLEVALVKMVKMTNSVQFSDLLNELKKKSSHKESNPIAPPHNDKSTLYNHDVAKNLLESSDSNKLTQQEGLSQEHPLIDLEIIENRWQEIVELVKRRKIALGSYLCEGWPSQVNGSTLELGFPGKSTFQQASVERGASLIEQVIKETLGIPVRLQCVRDQSNTIQKRRKFPARTDKKSLFEQLLKENKIIKQIVDTFDAEFIQ